MNANIPLTYLLSTLAPVGVSHWEKYGMSRLYVNVGLVFQEADLRIPSDTEGMRFYLDLHTMTWHLTGKKKTDDALILALNELAELPALTKAYENIQQTAEAKSISDRELAGKTDDELISLVKSGIKDDDRALVWVQRISRLPMLSLAVINAIITADGYWFRNEALLSQKNFPADAYQKACRSERYKGTLTSRFACTTTDADLLDEIASKTSDSHVLSLVAENHSTRFDTLLSVARKGMLFGVLVNHPQMTDEILASLVPVSEWTMYAIATTVEEPGNKTIEALIKVTDSGARAALLHREADFLTAEILDSWTEEASVEFISKLVKHHNTSDETVMKLLDDHRQTVRTLAARTLESRGYVARWVKEEKA